MNWNVLFDVVIDIQFQIELIGKKTVNGSKKKTVNGGKQGGKS
jgi:hypothetical protein